MARIYRATYTATGPDGRRVKRKSQKWYIGYSDADGKYQRVAGFTDRIATQRRATDLEQAAQRGDRYGEHYRRNLSEHVADWRKALIDKGNTAKHAALVAGRVTKLLTGCGFARWPELTGSGIHSWLAERRAEGVSVRTCNFYIVATKGFCRWMVREKRAPENPIAHLQGGNAKTDPRHDRRALSADELRRLLDAASTGPEHFGIDGADRAIVYRVAAETGLRANELRTLTAGAFDLDAEPPTVTVKAGYSKHRREDVLPLRPELVEALRTYLAGKLPEAPALRVPERTAEMMLADLEAARAAWLAEAETPKEHKARSESSFLAYRDEAGRVADFHALRHTFITGLARGGVHPKLAQQLARHSTITLTMDRYSHTVLPDLSDALAALPDLTPQPKQPDQQRATGTAGAEPVEAPMTDSALRELYVDSCESLRTAADADAKRARCQADDTARKTNNDKGFPYSRPREGASDSKAADRTRTDDLRFTKPLLYQLSYGGQPPPIVRPPWGIAQGPRTCTTLRPRVGRSARGRRPGLPEQRFSDRPRGGGL